jgi:DNA-binding NtrC family response regulator
VKRIVDPFLRMLCEVCGAERARLRVSVSEEDRSVVILDHRQSRDGAGRHGRGPGVQIPLLESEGIGAGPLVPYAERSSPFGEDAVCAAREHGGAPSLARWDFARDLHGLRFELSLFLNERGAGFINDRLSRAQVFLDLFESIFDGRSSSDGPSAVESAPGATFSPPFLGDAPTMRELRGKIALLSASDVPILIEGESGTGKEVVAQNIHRLSKRRAKPLVIASSSEMPHSLFQSELFGHSEGAFTGASRDRTGLIESASGGTFFLDEIGEMPLPLQAALLRVLQEREVRRLGESRRRAVDVRFVFATNRDLRELAAKGRFRKDLYFRIGGVRLVIPPLRMRREDIVTLATHFLSCAAVRVGRRAPALAPETIRCLVKYQWPGNVRELKAEMERLIAVNGCERVIVPESLSPHVDEADEMVAMEEGRGRATIPQAVQRLERAMIRDALGRFAGNRTKAAEALGITRQGLLKKLKRYSGLAGEKSS